MTHIKLFKENSEYDRKKQIEPTYQKVASSPIGTILPESDIYVYAEYLHTRPDDWTEGDLGNRIEKSSRYQLLEVDIRDIDIAEWDINDDVVDDYMQILDENNGYCPPIILEKKSDNELYCIIDGIHRANAVSEAGYTKINSWVGL